MKKLHLAFLSFAAAASLQVSAADLKKPDLQDILSFQPFAAEDTVFVYNVGQKMFFGAGEAYGTQGAVTETGLPVVFKRDDKYPGTYAIWAEVPGKTDDQRWSFRQSGDGTVGQGVKTIFTDNTWDRNEARWVVNELGGNKYTITIPESYADYVEGEALGVLLEHESAWATANTVDGITHGLYYDVNVAENADNCTWQFVPNDIIKAYNYKDKLAEKIDEAEKAGIDVSEAVSIYNSKTATLKEEEDAVNKLVQAMVAQASPTNPINMDYYIVNPTFDVDVHGWESTTGKDPQVNHQADQPDGTINGGYSNKVEEGTSIVGHIYQNIEGLPQGVYRAEMAVYVAAIGNNSFENPEQYTYSITQNGTEKNPITQAMKVYEWFAFVGEDGKMQIGFAEDAPITKWIVFDNVKLTYYGNSIDSYKYATEYTQKAIVDNIEEEDDNGQANFTKSYLESVNEIAGNVASASTPDAAIDAYHQITKAGNDLTVSENLYVRMKEEVNNLDIYIRKMGLDMEQFLDELEGIQEEATISNEELQAELDDIRTRMTDFVKLNIEDGNEYPFIANGTFPNASLDGWTLTGTDGCKGGDSGVIEFWNVNGWDLSQKFTGMKPGVWRFEVSATYRCGFGGDGQNAWDAAKGREEGNNRVRTFFSANNESSPVVNMHTVGLPTSEFPQAPEDRLGRLETDWAKTIFQAYDEEGNPVGEPREQWEPSRVNCVDTYLHIPGHEKDYTKSVKGIVGENGELTIRLWNDDYDNNIGQEWSVIQEVHLYYEANNAEAIAPILQRMVDEDAAPLLEKYMYASEKQALVEAYNEAVEALKGTDGEKMMASYNKLEKAIKAAISINSYEQLKKANDELEATRVEYDEVRKTAEPEAVAEAVRIYAEVKSGLENGSYKDEEVANIIAQVKTATFNLKKPKGVASDTAPQDWTFMIVNPEYKEKATGWTIGTGGKTEVESDYNTGMAEIWNNDGEISQTIQRLPVGTYKVNVQAFYRQGAGQGQMNTLLVELANKYGFAEELEPSDYEGVTEKENNAVLFGNESGIAPGYMCFDPAGSEDLAAIFTSAPGFGWLNFENWFGEFVEEFNTDTYGQYWWFPNSLNNAAQRFSNDLYDNEFYVNVVDDSDDDPTDGFGSLTLGARIFNHHDQDWLPFSNWRLEYYGAESAHASEANDYNEKASIEGVTANAEIVSVEFFSIDGKKLAAPQQGLNIMKAKTADGKVIVRKIVKK